VTAVIKYLIISESTFNDEAVTSEVVSLHSTYNRALTALADIANEFEIELPEDDSSFMVGDPGNGTEYYVTSIIEDES
jgi:hypothetical protein